ncbi:hypothetical protein J1614_010367 [Plenodomus biglobosus]|nr:hypothetical protein J1614_010367 [Plenodomus biglobosus]
MSKHYLLITSYLFTKRKARRFLFTLCIQSAVFLNTISPPRAEYPSFNYLSHRKKASQDFKLLRAADHRKWRCNGPREKGRSCSQV